MTDQIKVPKQTWDAVLGALEKTQGDINWMLNSRQFLNGHVFDYVEAALTAADSVSHPNPETAPVTEGGAITSESAANAVQPQGVADKSCINCKHDDIASSEMPCNQCFMNAGYPRWEPQAQGESYSERWYGSGEDRGWWIVRGGLVKREHVAFLGEFVSPEEVSKVVAELNAAHPQATEPAGYKLVPVEPTPEMIAAIWAYKSDSLQDCYRALLAAAPEAKQ